MRRWWDHMRDIMETKPDGEPVATPLQPMFHMSMTGMAAPRHVAIIDVGKTNAKVSLVDADDVARDARCARSRTRRGPTAPTRTSTSRGSGISSQTRSPSLNREAAIDAIAITAHGSAGAFIVGDPEGDGLSLPILDYEFTGPDELACRI